MALKSILVHVADDESHCSRLNLGLKLARAHGAHLRALFLTQPANMPAAAAGRAASHSFIQDLRARAAQKAAALQVWFAERCDAEGLTHDWIVEDGQHLDRLSHHAHVADLLIVSQSPARTLEDYVSLSIGESVALAVGCPTICLPHAWTPDDQSFAERVLIAWRGDREAVRAVRGAMPLLRTAQSVSVITIEKPGEDAQPEEVAAYLARHGVDATVDVVQRGGRAVADALLDEATARNADLVVMGAYSRSTIRELLLGGVSRTLFTQDHLPILASH